MIRYITNFTGYITSWTLQKIPYPLHRQISPMPSCKRSSEGSGRIRTLGSSCYPHVATVEVCLSVWYLIWTSQKQAEHLCSYIWYHWITIWMSLVHSSWSALLSSDLYMLFSGLTICFYFPLTFGLKVVWSQKSKYQQGALKGFVATAPMGTCSPSSGHRTSKWGKASRKFTKGPPKAFSSAVSNAKLRSWLRSYWKNHTMFQLLSISTWKNRRNYSNERSESNTNLVESAPTFTHTRCYHVSQTSSSSSSSSQCHGWVRTLCCKSPVLLQYRFPCQRPKTR